MTDRITDATLDERLRAADPLRPGALPSGADTEVALRRLLEARADPRRGRVGPGLRGRLARPRLLAGTTIGAVALGTAVALMLGATASPQAFAVSRNPDGTVTVKLIRLSGIAGANHALAAMGVRAKLVAALAAVRVANLQPCVGQPAGSVRTITFNPATIPPRQVLLLAADRAARLGYYSAAGKLRTAARSGVGRGARLPSVAAGVAVPNLAIAGNARASAAAMKRVRALVKRAKPITVTNGLVDSTRPPHQLRVYCGRGLGVPVGGG